MWISSWERDHPTDRGLERKKKWKKREANQGPASLTIVHGHQTLALSALEHGRTLNNSREGEALQPRRLFHALRFLQPPKQLQSSLTLQHTYRHCRASSPSIIQDNPIIPYVCMCVGVGWGGAYSSGQPKIIQVWYNFLNTKATGHSHCRCTGLIPCVSCQSLQPSIS